MAVSKLIAINKKIENAVTGCYRKIENGAVSGYKRIEDKFVAGFLTRDNETTEEAKARLKAQVL